MTQIGFAAPVADVRAQTGANGDRDSAGWVAAALEGALRERAPGVHASTPLVGQLSLAVGRELGLDARARALLDVAVRVRDIGMIGLPDTVVLTTTTLTPGDWELLNRHPVIGADMLGQLLVVAPAALIVRGHHERWDGGGYPDGLSGVAIPRLSRVIAACDAFVAMAHDRPHRRGIGAEAALDRVVQERGVQFDPEVVDAVNVALVGQGARRPARRRTSGSPRAPGGLTGLHSAIADFDPLPVYEPAYEKVRTAMADAGTAQSELVGAIESDTGLTIAILRRSQSCEGRRRIANVSDAVAALTPEEVEAAIEALPRLEFPWRTSPLELLMHRPRLHAQAVARVAARIAREVDPDRRDDILVAALLHDIGKLVMSRALTELPSGPETTTTPEERVRQEQGALAMDHASLGALALQEWGLPDSIAATVAAHHSAEGENEVATYVRLADMIAHHAQGDAVSRTTMLRLAGRCGLSAQTLRDVMFDLPHSGGSRRHRADPSPLTKRETAVLRVLAEGKVYKAIAVELTISASTVRTHLHHIYEKLAVDNRAQAVLRATEMGWI